MSSRQKPRTPRYFPRMKVRGARRRKRAPFDRMAGVFDRIGWAALDWQVQYATALLAFRPRVILGADMAAPRGYGQMQVITDEATHMPLTGEDIALLGTSILKGEHGNH